MEELAEGPIRLIAKLILVVLRAIIWFTWEMLGERFMWYLGWPIARIITLGKFPNESFTNVDHSGAFDHFIVAIIGIAWPAGLAYLLAIYLGV